jgi:hypothetical protein
MSTPGKGVNILGLQCSWGLLALEENQLAPNNHRRSRPLLGCCVREVTPHVGSRSFCLTTCVQSSDRMGTASAVKLSKHRARAAVERDPGPTWGI